MRLSDQKRLLQIVICGEDEGIRAYVPFARQTLFEMCPLTTVNDYTGF